MRCIQFYITTSYGIALGTIAKMNGLWNNGKVLQEGLKSGDICSDDPESTIHLYDSN